MTRVKLKAAELFVEDRGSGDVLLLVHGFPLDHSMWSAQIDTLSAHCRVIAPDLRGFGASSAIAGIVSMAEYADDLADLLAALHVTHPITLCGLSMGGYIAWQFWQKHRQSIQRLVLCDTQAKCDSTDAAKQRLKTADRVLEIGTGFLAEDMPAKLFSAAGRRETEKVNAIQQVIRSTSPEAVAAALRGMAERPDMSHILPQISVPALVVCGADDAITPADEMREMANSMPQARFLEIANAGHMAPFENPGPVSAAILEFLSQ